MKPAEYDSLLKSLQKLHKLLSRDLVAQVRADPARLAWAQARWKAAAVGGSLDEWVDVAAGRTAVQVLLRTVYVRVLEDLGLLSPVRLRGDRGYRAFRDVAPSLGRQAFFQWIFRDLAVDLPGLFTPGPDEPGLPGEEACEALWAEWHRDHQGRPRWAWDDAEGFDGRFLGDLYQDLDAEVRARYALLQTPPFVESYILDLAMTPALAEFQAGAMNRAPTGGGDGVFRLLDPTCGSGHFLVGGFRRLLSYWTRTAPELPVLERIRRALDGIWGSDLNPYAVSVAELRLRLEARRAAAEEGLSLDLSALAELPVHLLAADSLVPWEKATPLGVAPAEGDAVQALLARTGTAEEREAARQWFGRDFHCVVGNPPYITPKDPQKREDYRVFWPASCHMKYALSVPFTERFLRLLVPGGHTGMITANSFMKRQFGQPLIQQVLPRFDLTHVVDTSGAFIPGHGTPTVILVARNRAPQGEAVRAVLGIRGEPSKPAVAEEGLVWTSIARHTGEVGYEDEFISVDDVEREVLAKHPWSVQGGAAPELLERLNASRCRIIGEVASEAGITSVTGQDEVYMVDAADVRRAGSFPHRPLVTGDVIRDFDIGSTSLSVWTHGDDLAPVALNPGSSTWRELWPYREALRHRKRFGTYMVLRGLTWWEWQELYADKLRTPLTVSWAFVATHNHFVLDRGGKVFNRSAPVIKLPPDADEDTHLDLLGLLNSSTLGFWMRMNFQAKGGSGMGRGIQPEDWMERLEYDATKLKNAPLVTVDRPARITLARQLDTLARQRAACLPAAVLADPGWTAADLALRLDQARQEHDLLTAHMVAVQEELDWLTYRSYGLVADLDLAPPQDVPPLTPGHRPFEIALARRMLKGDADTRYFERHDRTATPDIPAHLPPEQRARLQQRLDLIARDRRIRLLEAPEYKRRWQPVDWPAQTSAACEAWLLDRLEDLFAPGGRLSRPGAYTLEDVVAAWRAEPRVLAVAQVHQGTANVDVDGLAETLLRAHALPDNPHRLYSEEGLRKYRQWQRVWALQDQEDAQRAAWERADPTSRPAVFSPRLLDPETGAPVDRIPLPPKYEAGDFQKARSYALRGKLDVPRERFVLFADLSPVRYGWNGWRDLDRARAQVKAFGLARSHPEQPLSSRPTGADPRRCGPSLGLWDRLDDARRWGDPDEALDLRFAAEDACGQKACPCGVLPAWQALLAQGYRPGDPRPGGAAATAVAPHQAPPTPSERQALLERVRDAPSDAITPATLARGLSWHPERVRTVADSLVADGLLEALTRPDRYRLRPQQGDLPFGA